MGRALVSVMAMATVMAMVMVMEAAAEGPERPVCPDQRCQEDDYTRDEYFYRVNGVKLVISFVEGRYLSVQCSVPLESDALPRFPRPFTFPRVSLSGCLAADYGAALGRLNASGASELSLERVPAAGVAALSARSFGALPALRDLRVRAAAGPPAPAPADALAALGALEALTLVGVRPPRLPAALARLALRRCGLRALPADLPAGLRDLDVEDELADAAAAARLPALRRLALTAPLEAWPPLGPAAARLTLAKPRLRAPPPLAECAALRELAVAWGTLSDPPRGWLARCPTLAELSLEALAGFSFPEGLLEGAAELTSLRIAHCGLTSLPADAFRHSPKLRTLTLAHNALAALGGGALAPLAGGLRALDLSHNRLSAGAAAAVGPLAGLRSLSLAGNPLGEACGGAVLAASFLAGLRALERLSLSGAGLTRLCADWLRGMPLLRNLDLTANRIEVLRLEDVNAVRRRLPSVVALNKNPIRVLEASEQDFLRAAAAVSLDNGTTFELDATLECDCHSYWAWRLLRAGRVVPRLEPRCAGGAPLRAAAPLALACAVPPPACPPRCRCEDAPAAGGLLLRCAAPPAERDLRAAAAAAHRPVRRLDLAGAGLAALPARLPTDLQFLNLSDNRIAEASGPEAEYVLSRARRLALAGNPLRCACDAPLLRALRPHAARLDDLSATVCAGGGPLAAALAADCPDGGPGVPAGAALAALALALAALAAGVLRARAKCWLERWRGGGGEAEAEEEWRPFDVYLSCPGAEERAALALARRLRAAGLAVLVPAAHWRPGAWVPAARAASVGAARRTLVLVAAGASPAELALAAAQHAPRRPRLLLLVPPGAEVPKEAPPGVPCIAWRPDDGDRLVKDILRHVPPLPLKPLQPPQPPRPLEPPRDADLPPRYDDSWRKPKKQKSPKTSPPPPPPPPSVFTVQESAPQKPPASTSPPSSVDVPSLRPH